MKSREVRQREAWQVLAWIGMAVAALLIVYGLVEEAPVSGIVGLGPVIGASLGAGVTYMLTRRQRRWERQAAYPSYVACIEAARSHGNQLAKLDKTWESTKGIERQSEPGPEEVVRIIVGEFGWDAHSFTCWPDTIDPRAK